MGEYYEVVTRGLGYGSNVVSAEFHLSPEAQQTQQAPEQLVGGVGKQSERPQRVGF